MTTATQAPQTRVVPFTARDVVWHTLTVWATLMVLTLVYLAITSPDFLSDTSSYGFFSSIAFGYAVIAFALTWLGAPLAWLLARALRSVHRVWVHLLAFGVLGFGAGLAVAFALVVVGPMAESAPLFAVILAAVCGACTAFGRWVAFRLRRRREATRAR